MPKTIPWTRLLTESVLIVSSILIAFGIEAAWQKRGDTVRSETVLAQIAEDFRVHGSVAKTGLDGHGLRATSAAEMLKMVGPNATPESGEALLGFQSIATFNAVNFQAGILETVLANESLAIVRDAELREALTSWSYRVAELEEIQAFVISESIALDVYLQTRRPQRSPRQIGEVEVAASAFEWDPAMIFRDLEFENLLLRQAEASDILAGRLERMRRLADEIVRMAENG